MVVGHATTYPFKQPMHDSILTGAAWVLELLDGHERQFYEALGMTKVVFLHLRHELREVSCDPKSQLQYRLGGRNLLSNARLYPGRGLAAKDQETLSACIRRSGVCVRELY